METKIDKEKLLKEYNERLNELDELQEVEDMIQDNSIEFPFNEETYRVRKLTRREKHEIQEKNKKERNRLLRDSDNLTEEGLIKLYLNRKEDPVNIPELRQKVKDLQHEIDKIAIRVTESKIDSEKKRLEDEANDIALEQLEILYKIDDCLNSSVEKQLKSFVQEYMIYLCLEKLVDEKWQRHYASYEKFMDTNNPEEDKLIYKATWYFSVLINKDE